MSLSSGTPAGHRWRGRPDDVPPSEELPDARRVRHGRRQCCRARSGSGHVAPAGRGRAVEGEHWDPMGQRRADHLGRDRGVVLARMQRRPGAGGPPAAAPDRGRSPNSCLMRRRARDARRGSRRSVPSSGDGHVTHHMTAPVHRAGRTCRTACGCPRRSSRARAGSRGCARPGKRAPAWGIQCRFLC